MAEVLKSNLYKNEPVWFGVYVPSGSLVILGLQISAMLQEDWQEKCSSRIAAFEPCPVVSLLPVSVVRNASRIPLIQIPSLDLGVSNYCLVLFLKWSWCLRKSLSPIFVFPTDIFLPRVLCINNCHNLQFPFCFFPALHYQCAKVHNLSLWELHYIFIKWGRP